MKSIWFINNPHSGSTSPERCAALEAHFAAAGLTLAGKTSFPDAPLPDGAMLDAAGADTAILFAGDGTINAAVAALEGWQGAILILPGGTMNLLAKLLHDTLDPVAIVDAALRHAVRVSLPYAEAAGRRALVGLIIGPVASWVRAREMVRAGRLRGLWRAITHAWRRTFSRGVRLRGVPRLKRRPQAVFVRAEEAALDIAAVDARDFLSIAQLGWEWMTGDWVASPAVTHVQTRRFRIGGRKPAMALFDGEPAMLPPGTPVTLGHSPRIFLSTRPQIQGQPG